MDLILNKKGFAFTFLTLFISFLMFSFAAFLLSEDTFNSESSFVNARISQISSEIKYFEDSYLQTAGAFALFNVLDALLNSSYNSSFYSNINNNYTSLNLLLEEGMVNGSFLSVPHSELENKTLSYFLNQYEKNVETNLNLNFSYEVLDVYLFEKTPFFVGVQIHLVLNFTTNDNLSEWNIKDLYEVEVPIYSFEDPDFVIHNKRSIPIRPIELFASNIDWDLNLLNESIREFYSVVYLEPVHDYTIGSSFISRILNVSGGSFKDSLLRYSFDLDQERGPVYDYVIKNEKGLLYGDSIAIFDFDNESISQIDKSSYSNNLVINGATWINLSCQFEGCYIFDDVGDNITVPYNDSFNFKNSSFTINMWINTFKDGSIQRVFNKEGMINLDLSLNQTNHFEILLTNMSPSIMKSSNSISINSWNMLTLAINPQSQSYFYLNGNEEIELDTENLFIFNNTGDFVIGGNGAFSFNGSIDEIGIYKRELNAVEVAKLYQNRRTKFIEYEDSFYGKKIKLDGIDDYIQTNGSEVLGDSFSNNNFSIVMWFVPREEGPFTLVNYEGEFLLEYNLGNISFNDDSGNPSLNSSFDFELNELYNLILIRDSNMDNNKLYVNGELIYEVNSTGWSPQLDGGDLTFGSRVSPNNSSNSNYFKGSIDEIMIYSKSLNSDEVLNHFYNYRSSVKGCCNFITVVNSNELGYNDSNFNDNVSYSSKLFYDHYIRNTSNQVTIYNITNITSAIESENYYNLMFDLCLMDAYNIFSYNHTNQPAFLIQSDSFNSTCSGLVAGGVY